jgi:hypothetical protein
MSVANDCQQLIDLIVKLLDFRDGQIDEHVHAALGIASRCPQSH